MPTVPRVTRSILSRDLKALSAVPFATAAVYSSYRFVSQGPIFAFGECLTASNTVSGESGTGAATEVEAMVAHAARIAAILARVDMEFPPFVQLFSRHDGPGSAGPSGPQPTPRRAATRRREILQIATRRAAVRAARASCARPSP